MNECDINRFSAGESQRQRGGRCAEGIAVVGIGCRFPGGSDGPDELWANLVAGRDCISEVPEERWQIGSFFNPRRGVAGKSVTKWGGFIDGIDCFDAQFFGISPREAALMDPQQRLLLEVSWEAFEDAGFAPGALAGAAVGVFVGGFTLDYMLMQLGAPELRGVEPHTATGSMMTLLSNRLSYVYGFNGPSISVDTACSSSLVAIHLACNSLRDGESKIAVAGGVNALLGPGYTVAESRAGMLSPSGRSRAFDSRADGYVRGEGAGLVVLKPLREALADGDHIYSVICASAVNQDGASEGLTVPSGEAQVRLMREAYARAGITPAQLTYVEAHGTGTPVGDPIEANAIGSVVSEARAAGEPCLLGSLKTNIGHTEAAAGVAGLIKASLVLAHRMVPPHLHLQQANPKIDLARLGLRVPDRPVDLGREGPALFAGVNSFGFGGTNAHAVLRSQPKADGSPPGVEDGTGAWLLPLSARSPVALRELAADYADMVERADSRLTDICYSAALRREHHGLRFAAVGDTREALVATLRQAAGGALELPEHALASAARPVFVYTGMGPQWWGMGQELYRTEPVFRASVQRCAELFERFADWSILDAMLANEADSRMDQTEVSQPANFILQVALTDLFAAWGIRPAAIVGHSAGEPAAAYAAGVLTLEDAVTVIFHRSRLQQRTTGRGRMLAVGLPRAEIAERMAAIGDPTLAFAAINSPTSVTVTGSDAGIAALEQSLAGDDVFVRALRVNVPYHSCFMDPYRQEMLAGLARLAPRRGHTPLYSAVSGELIEGGAVDGEYWYRNVRQPVEFARAAAALAADGYDLFLEVGPHQVLASSIQEIYAGMGRDVVVAHALRRAEPEGLHLRRALATLYGRGVLPAWQAVCAPGRYVRLPRYRWQRERHWHELDGMRAFRLAQAAHPLLGRRLDALHPTWECDLDNPALEFIADHVIQGTVVFPGAGYMEMAAAAARELYGHAERVSFAEIRFLKALYLNGDGPVQLRIAVNPADHSFQIVSRAFGHDDAPWQTHCTGRMLLAGAAKPDIRGLLSATCALPEAVGHEACYARFAALGLEYRDAFRGIAGLRRSESAAMAQLRLPESLQADLEDYLAHPAVLDLCFQTLAAALPAAGHDGQVFMPVAVRHWRLCGSLERAASIRAAVTKVEDGNLHGDLAVLDEAGELLLEMRGCRAQAIGAAGASLASGPQSLYVPRWVQQALASEQQVEAGAWLVAGAPSVIDAALTASFAAAGHEVLGLDGAGTAPVRREEWEDALGRRGEGIGLRGIIVFPDSAVLDPADAAQETSLMLLGLLQACAARAWTVPPRIWVVTRGAQALDAAEIPDVRQAPLWGMARVLGHAEHAELWGGIVDIEREAGAEVGTAIAAECLGRDREDQVALRGGVRHVLRLAPLPPEAELPNPPALRPDATYLVTGGLGALGAVVARWLIERGARHLLLLGREALPPRQTWARLAPEDPKYGRVALVRALESAGASVRVAAADVADRAAIDRLLAEHDAGGHPPIRGVIHSAGIAVPQLLAQMTEQDFVRVLRPKVHGGWNLHAAFAGRELDLFILFSSVASLVTSVGQGNYAAANAFLDCLAQRRRAQGLPALATDWGPWGDVGMAAELNLVDFFAGRGLRAMAARDGVDALGRLMGDSVPQAVVLDADWHRVAESTPGGVAPPMLDDLLVLERQAGARGEGDAQEADICLLLAQCGDEGERRELLLTHLRAVVCRVLRIDEARLGAEDGLNQWGLDSMMAIELKNRVERALGVSVAVVDLLRGVSVASLADAILPELQDRIAIQGSREMSELADSLQQLSADELAAILAGDTQEVVQ